MSVIYSVIEVGLIYLFCKVLSLEFTTIVAVWALVTANIIYTE